MSEYRSASRIAWRGREMFERWVACYELDDRQLASAGMPPVGGNIF